MSVLEIDQHWPEARNALMADSGIVVTRDGEAIGKLVPLETPKEQPRKRFDAEAHKKWLNEFWGEETFDSLPGLLADREDRKLL